MTIKPTVTALKALEKPAKGTVTHTIQSGFYARISATGSITFLAKYRLNGKAAMQKVGTFDGSKKSIDDALKALNHLQQQVAENHVPTKERKPKDAAKTFAELWPKYLDWCATKKKPNRPSTLREKKRLIEKHVLPYWKNHPVDAVTFEVWEDLEQSLKDDGRSPRSIGLVAAPIKSFFNWCKKQRHIPYNPLEDIEVFTNEERGRELSTEELQRLWIGFQGVATPYRQFFQLCMLTGQRRSVVASIKWSDLDKELDGTMHWVIPSDALGNKASQPMTLEMTPQMRKVISGIEKTGEYLFPARRNADKPISGFSDLKEQIDKAIKDKGFEPVKDWRIHDFRRALVSRLQKMGITYEVAQILIGQKPLSAYGAMKHYALYRYGPECSKALALWNDWLVNNVIVPNERDAREMKKIKSGEMREAPKDSLVHFGARAFE